MRQLVQVARSRGIAVECQSCHTDERTFTLGPMAGERLRLLLTALNTPVYVYYPGYFPVSSPVSSPVYSRGLPNPVRNPARRDGRR